jgi:hypothetical protein
MAIPSAIDLDVVIFGLSCPQYALEVSMWLTIAEERAFEFIASRESLYALLSAIQKVIDSPSRPSPDSSDHNVSDITRAQALTSYTAIIIEFQELAEPIRLQFVRALVDMVFRRNMKRKDYVNSFLRATACECLSELELAFPGEVSMVFELPAWYEDATSTVVPVIIETLADESLPCSENYAKLLLRCSMTAMAGTVQEKALMKVVSLLLDSVEFGSPWLRGLVATQLSGIVQRASLEKPESLWTFAVVHHHFSRLLDSASPHQIHAFLHVAHSFVDEWDPYLVDRVVERLYSIVENPSIAVPVRQTAVLWLCELLDDYYMKFSVYERRSKLMPIQRRDPDTLIEVKLQALLRYASSFGSLPREILRANPHQSASMHVTFRHIVRLLNDFCPSVLDNDKTQLLDIPTLLKELLVASNSAQVLPSIIETLRLTKNERCRSELLVSLGQFLISAQPPSKIITNYFLLLAFLACQRDLDADLVLSALRRFRADSPQWTDGLKFIEICRLLILHHACDDKVVDLLDSMKWWSLDIEERAQSLVRVIRTLAGDHERRKFLNPREDLCSTPSEVSDDISQEQLDECDHLGTKSAAKSGLQFMRNESLRRDKGINDQGFAAFESGGLILPFTLRLADNSSGEMFSIELSFSVSPNHQPFGIVSSPYLTYGEEQSFPFQYEVELRLVPVHPVPATFSAFAVYTDRAGKSHQEELEPFRVSLEDLFLPVPNTTNITELWNSKWQPDQAFAKLLSIKRDTLKQLITERLAPFLVPPELISELQKVDEFDFEHELLLHGDNGENESPLFEETAVIIHLPPEYHLMIRFVMGLHTCVAWIATDRTDVLALLDPFFLEWSNSLS